MKVKARVSKTNKFREVTLRRDPEADGDRLLYTNTPAYLHVNSQTVSGVAYETKWGRWVFKPHGKNSYLI